MATGRNFAKSTLPPVSPQTLIFPQTGHSVTLFKDWWTANGGIPVFGFPLSDGITGEKLGGRSDLPVQYFERNRLESHPENKGTPAEVTLGLLGVEYLSKLGCKP